MALVSSRAATSSASVCSEFVLSQARSTRFILLFSAACVSSLSSTLRVSARKRFNRCAFVVSLLGRDEGGEGKLVLEIVR